MFSPFEKVTWCSCRLVLTTSFPFSRFLLFLFLFRFLFSSLIKMSTPVVNSNIAGRPVPPTPTQGPDAKAQAQAAAMNALDFVKNKSNYYLTRLDRELSKHECTNDIERRTGVPKTYFVLGTSIIFFLMIFLNLGAQLLTNAISWIYPGKFFFCFLFSKGYAVL